MARELDFCETSCAYDCPLDELARLMSITDWQHNKLAQIKTRFGYKLASLVYGTLDTINCSNLFNYIDDKDYRYAHYQPIEERKRRVTIKMPDDDVIGEAPKRKKSLEPLDEMNARIFGRNRKWTRAIFVSRLLLVYVSCCACGMFISTCLQYNYDFYKYHLGRLNPSRLTSDDQILMGPVESFQQATPMRALYEHVNVTEAELLDWVGEARNATKLFGSFLLNRAFFAESCYTLMVLLCFFTYLGPMIYYRKRGPFDFHHLRMLLDWDQEQLNCNHMIVDLIGRLTLSSQIFMQISRDIIESRYLGFCFKRESNQQVKSMYGQARRSCQSLAVTPTSNFREFGSPKQDTLLHEANLLAKQQAYADEHDWMAKKLKRLALTGQLQPLDRNNVDELASSSFMYAFFVLQVTSSCFIWNIILFTSLPLKFNFHYELDFMDKVSLLELATLNVLLTIGGAFYLSLALVHCREQVRVVSKLRQMIATFVVKHRRTLIQYSDHLTDCGAKGHARSSGNGSCCSLYKYYDLINTELILILMQYKIFTTQLRPSRKTFGFTLFNCVCMAIIFPIIARLHMPYLRDQESRILSIIVCFIMIGLSDFAIVPMCWMNSRSLGLCHSLWNLMAILVELQEHQKLGTIVSEHSLWLLRKELSHPEQLKGQFAIMSMGIEFTYAELLKLHFWIGVLVLSFSIELNNQPNPHTNPLVQANDRGIMFGSLFADPLGIISGFEN